MMKKTPLLSIITISYNDPQGLQLTVDSVANQTKKPFEHILLLSGIDDTKKNSIVEHYTNSYTQIYINVDSSLYNAMNIGLDKSKGNAVCFLNGGDSFFDNNAIHHINNLWEPNKCLIFRSLIYYESDMFIKPSKKNFKQILNFITHQSFVCPHSKNYVSYMEEKKIDADTFWIKENLSKYGYIASLEILSNFQLGGLSSYPSLKTLKLRIKTKQRISKCIYELIKILMLNTLGKKRYFRLICKSNHFEKYNSK